jgi:hypothetical protein
MNKTERYELFIKVCKKVADAYGLSLKQYFDITLNRSIIDYRLDIDYRHDIDINAVYDFKDAYNFYLIWESNRTAEEPCDTCVHYTKERVDRFEYCDRCKWNCNDHYEPIV